MRNVVLQSAELLALATRIAGGAVRASNLLFRSGVAP